MKNRIARHLATFCALVCAPALLLAACSAPGTSGGAGTGGSLQQTLPPAGGSGQPETSQDLIFPLVGPDWDYEVAYHSDEQTIGPWSGPFMDVSGADIPPYDGSVWVVPWASSGLEVGAAAWALYDDDTVHIATSTDGGASWKQATVVSQPVRTPGSFARLGFVTRRHGWLLLVGEEFSPAASELYTTADGGQSWQLAAAGLPGDRQLWDCVFTTPETGFLTYGSGEGGPLVQQTEDGGKTWRTATVQLPASLPGRVESAGLYRPQCTNGQWDFPIHLNMEGWPNFLQSSLPFVYEPGQDALVWRSPGWSLPEGVDEATFFITVNALLPFMPPNHKEGDVPDVGGIYIADVASSIATAQGRPYPTGGEYDDVLVPVADIQALAQALFGAELDTEASFGSVYEGSDAIAVGPHGYGPMFYTVRDAAALPGGEVEVFLDWLGEGGTVSTTTRFVLRPVEYSGLPLLRIVLAETLL